MSSGKQSFAALEGVAEERLEAKRDRMATGCAHLKRPQHFRTIPSANVDSAWTLRISQF